MIPLPRRPAKLTAHDLNTALLRVGAQPGHAGGIHAFLNGPVALLTDGEAFQWSGNAHVALARLATLPTARGREADARLTVQALFAQVYASI